MLRLYISIIVCLLFTSCGELNFSNLGTAETVIAKVGNNELYLSNIEGLLHANLSPQDSTAIIDNYIERWCRKMLKVDLATEHFVMESKDIDSLMIQYRQSLLINKYDNLFTSKVDTVVTAAQIAGYYNNYKDLFHLPGPIVKGAILVFPKNHNSQKKLIALMKSHKENDRIDLLDMVKKNDLSITEYRNWTYFTELLSNIPFADKSVDDFLKKSSFYHISDDNNEFVMVIEAYKNSGDFTPVEMIRPNIEKMIINGRRKALLREVEDSIYTEAVEGKNIVINKVF